MLPHHVNTWMNIRGQEYDPWKPTLNADLEMLRRKYDPRHYDFLDGKRSNHKLQHAVNREFFKDEADFPLPRCFEAGFEFLDAAREIDNWLLQLECFDPHEPFHVPERFEREYSAGYNGLILDWPQYARVDEIAEEIAHIRAKYAGLVAMCDDYLGRLLDRFDEENLWKDTVLIATTDDGYLLSEHDWWAKTKMPQYSGDFAYPADDFPSRPVGSGGNTTFCRNVGDRYFPDACRSLWRRLPI